MEPELPWVEKYRPHSLDDVVGNGPAVASLKKWAQSWEDGIPDKRAVVLSGKPGLGKTSAALALAADMKWGVIELNASDARNEDIIKRTAVAGALNETFRDDGAFIKAAAGGRKLIIMDEADNISGREDRGGVPATIEMIRQTKQPVVLIVNDYYGLTRRASSLRSLSLEIKFQALRVNQVEAVLKRLAAQEGVAAAPEVMRRIAENAHGDLRAAINDLESVARGRKEIPASAVEHLGGRDARASAYAMVGEVLHTFDLLAARKALWDLDESPDFSLLWIEENVPLEYRHPPDLDRAFYHISRADVFLGRTVRRQAFGLWSYATDLMGAGVAVSKSESVRGFTRYNFPSWLMQMGRSKAVRRQRNETFGRLGAYFHTSRHEVGLSIAPYLPKLMNLDFDLAVQVAAGAVLSAEDLAELLEKEVESREVKAIITQAKALLDSGRPLGVAAESMRGARKGSISLGEAVKLAQDAEAAAKSKPAKGRKKKGEKAEEAAPKEEPKAQEPAPEPAKESTPEEAAEEPPPQKSLFEF